MVGLPVLIVVHSSGCSAAAAAARGEVAGGISWGDIARVEQACSCGSSICIDTGREDTDADACIPLCMIHVLYDTCIV